MTNVQKLISEIQKVNPIQPTTVAAVLLAIRARMECKAAIPNRIGKGFPNGNRGILFVGKAGVGKTRFMTKLFDGLGLDSLNSEGQVVGKWLPSTGGSTGIGMYEVLEAYNESIIFADELSLDTDRHVHVMKQIANGMLIRPRHGNIESTPFSGLLVGATNAVRLPGNTRDLEHLLATLDRFMVVKVRTPGLSPSDTMKKVLADEKDPEPDWQTIAEALVRKNVSDLTAEEEEVLQSLWDNKSREILDPTRAQWRNSQLAQDIFLFCKRFFGVRDLTKNQDILEFARAMIADCIIFNPIHILWMEPLEEVIFSTIASKELVTTQEILRAVDKAGISVSRQYIMRVINKMVTNYVILRTSRGKYSTKRDAGVVPYSSEGDTTELAGMIQPVAPKAVQELVRDL